MVKLPALVGTDHVFIAMYQAVSYIHLVKFLFVNVSEMYVIVMPPPSVMAGVGA